MKKLKYIQLFAFLAIVGGLSIGSFVAKDREFSDNENRYLAKPPKLSIEKILDCSFQDEAEEYLKDQVCLRDGWITVKTFFQKITGNTDIGGAYVGKDGYDFEKIIPEDVDDALVEKNTKAVNRFFEYCSKTISEEKLNFMLVPTSGLVYEDKLPNNAILFDQDMYIDSIASGIKTGEVIDARDVLVDSDEEYLYYKTDHHWTTDGAFLAYNQWRKAVGKSAIDKADVTEEIVTDKFRGSLYSKILDADSQYDSIEVINKKEASSFAVTADGEDIGSFYQEKKLSEKDKYAYFFGGNYGEVRIENKNNSAEGNLLVIKDSFANSFVPLVAGEFANAYMIDLRYYSGNLSKYLSENNITDVLVLYNVSNFISDKNIFKLEKNMEEN